MSVEAESARELGRYAVLDEIAAGGMATVHLGRVLDGSSPAGGAVEFVAIKKMHAQFSRDPDFRSMFLDEAKLVRHIEHENVVRTLDVVDGDELLLVMELIEGESLSRLAKQTAQRRERIPRGIVSAIMQDMLRGLHAAHEATNEAGEPLAIVHRDVSPHNVIVGTDGVARVLDFGVAKARGRMQQTQQGQIKGKLAYMSPEQARGKPVDRRSDIFASGIVLWELLVGARLFDGENEASVLTQLLVEKPSAPSSRHADLAPFDALVAKALETSSDERYPTTLAFAEAIGAAIHASPRAEVEAWVREEGKQSIERRSAILAMRARERRVPGEVPSPRDASSDIREGTPSGISRAGAGPANRSGVSYISLPAGPKPSSGLRFGSGAAPRPVAKPHADAVPRPTQPTPRAEPAPRAALPAPTPPPKAQVATPTPIVEEPSTASTGPVNEKTPPLEPSTGAPPPVAVEASPAVAPEPAPHAAPLHAGLAPMVPPPSFGVSSSGMIAFGAPPSNSQPPAFEPPPPSAPMSSSGGWAVQPRAPMAPMHPGMTARLQPIQAPSIPPAPTSQPGQWYGPPSAPPAHPAAAAFAPGAPHFQPALAEPPPLAPERVRRLLLIGVATAVLVALALGAILIIATSGGGASKTPTSARPSAEAAPTQATPASTTKTEPTTRALPDAPARPGSASAPEAPPAVSASASASATPTTSGDLKLVPIPTTSAKKKKPDYGF